MFIAMLHGNHAAVAAAEAATHDALYRNLRPLVVSSGEFRDGCEHRLRSARIDHRTGAADILQRRFERYRDAALDAAAAIFGCDHELDAESFKKIEIEQFVRGA